MAADVGYLVRIINGYKEEGEGKGRRSSDLITRDLLGGSPASGSKELDLDLKVPSGWERRLDLLSGETYLKKRGSEPVHRQLHDLNLPPLPEDSSTALDLKLLLPAGASTSIENQSVCTLEKVKSALERAERESQSKRRRSDGSPPPLPSSSTKGRDREDEVGTDESDSAGGNLIAAGCSGCLLYVLISKGNPRCPRCDSHVPVPVLRKKPRLDLNTTSN